MLPKTKQNKNRNQQLVKSSFSCLNCLRLHFYALHSCVLSSCSFELDEQQWHHQPRASSFRLAAHTPVDDCFRQNKTKKKFIVLRVLPFERTCWNDRIFQGKIAAIYCEAFLPGGESFENADCWVEGKN